MSLAPLEKNSTFSDKSRNTNKQWFKELEVGVSDAPITFLQRCIGVGFVDELVEIVGQ